MTQEKTLKYNKKCAKFLGWQNLNDESFPEYIDKLANFYSLKDLLFNSDWNWIMEVVEIIEKLDVDKNKFSSHPFYQGFDLETQSYYAHFQFGEDLNFNGKSYISKKEAAVEALNQFLTWYEQNNKS